MVIILFLLQFVVGLLIFWLDYKGVPCSWCDRQSKYTYTPPASRQVGPTAPGQAVEEEPLENQVEVLKMSHRELMERV